MNEALVLSTETDVEPDLIRRLQSQMERVLGDAIGAPTQVALLDHPNHPNVGDSAIWLGEVDYLAHRGLRIIYKCDTAVYDRSTLLKRLRGGVILLHGGGNFGDVWPAYQDFREQVVRDFPESTIVQLPQTIHFRDARRLERSRHVLSRHRKFTLLVRDERSYRFAERMFDVDVRLCPDMAFFLKSLSKSSEANRPDDIVVLKRTDAESAVEIPSVSDKDNDIRVTVKDWLDDERGFAPMKHRYLTGCLRRLPRAYDLVGQTYMVSCDEAARARLRRGVDLLGSGRVVITDRLHGHILCVLLGIPHVVLDNNYGKIAAVMDTWTRSVSFAKSAATVAQAMMLARGLLRSTSR